MSDKPMLTVTFPAFNEEENVAPLYERLTRVMQSIGKPYELLMVNDGSDDKTRPLWLEIMQGDKLCRLINHKKNFGESAAMLVGIWTAKADTIVTIASDMQNPPEEIPKLLAFPEYDCVAGIRLKRNDVIGKVIGSKIANAIRNGLTHDNIKDTGCGLKLFKKKAGLCIPPWRGVHRFLATMVKYGGFKVAQVGVEHAERLAGDSKYGHLGVKRIKATVPDVLAVRKLIAYENKYKDSTRGDFLLGPLLRQLPNYIEPAIQRPLEDFRQAKPLKDKKFLKWLLDRYIPIEFDEETI